jgi:hypothetical protein
VARKLYRDAYAAIDRGAWPEARDLLYQVWQRSKTHDVAAAIGQVEFNLGNYPVAAWHLAYALAHVPPQETLETSNSYREALEKAMGHVAAVTVEASRADAEISVDGKIVGRSPLQLDVFLMPGTHVIAGNLGTARAQEVVETVAGRTYLVRLALPAPQPAASASPPIDGGLGASSASAGHVSAAPAPTEQAESDGLRSGLLIAGAAITAVAAGSTVLFGLGARSAKNDADNLLADAERRFGPAPCYRPAPAAQDTCGRVQQRLEDRRDRATLANVSLAVGLAAGAGTLLTYFIWTEPSHSNAPSRSLRLYPALGNKAAGLSFQSQF